MANSLHNQLPTQRVLFKKITKGFDKKDFDLRQANMRIQELEAKLEQLKPRKRKKVQTSPNSKFATTRAIWEAQIAAGDREIGAMESELEEDSDFTDSFIEVDVA